MSRQYTYIDERPYHSRLIEAKSGKIGKELNPINQYVRAWTQSSRTYMYGNYVHGSNPKGNNSMHE